MERRRETVHSVAGFLVLPVVSFRFGALMLNRLWLVLCAALALTLGTSLVGCDGPVGVDAGIDVPLGVDAPSLDAPPDDDAPITADAGDAARDASDARIDVGPTDGGPDVPGPFDAGPDVSAEVAEALPLFCDPPAYGNCTAPWNCGCDTFGTEPPFDVETCVDRGSLDCEASFGPSLTALFRRGTATIDPVAREACIDARRHVYDLCQIPSESDFPVECWDAITVDIPVGASCEVQGVRCAGGDGACVGRTCVAVSSTAGDDCTVACGGGLACVDRVCATPLAAGAVCGDSEDCADGLCSGGRCGDPVPAGGACTSTDRCGTGLLCEGGRCTGPRSYVCTVGSGECGASTTCASRFLNVCLPQLGDGEMCNDGRGCSSGFCDFSTFPSFCRTAPSEGETCSGTCAEGVFCDFSTFPAICRTLPLEGEPCTGTCADELWCDFSDSFPGVCRSIPGDGERCNGTCEEGLFCDFSTFPSFCRVAPGLGETCFGTCSTGLACVWDAGFTRQTCQPRMPEGADCDGDFECREDLFCDFSSFPGTCSALGTDGQECGRCVDGLDCRFFSILGGSYCVPPGRLGEECGSLCDGNAYCGFSSDRGICQPAICSSVFPGGGGGVGPPMPFPGGPRR